ncbi:hypothetical protein D3C81_1275220 [compost metagenome]
MRTERLPWFDMQDRRHRVAFDQGIAVGHMRIAHRAQAIAAGQAKGSIWRASEAVPKRFGLVVDGHVRVVLGIVRYARPFRGHILHRPPVRPAHVQ